MPQLSEQQILNAVYDESAGKMSIITANTNQPTRLVSEQQMWNAIFDSSANKLKTQ